MPGQSMIKYSHPHPDILDIIWSFADRESIIISTQLSKFFHDRNRPLLFAQVFIGIPTNFVEDGVQRDYQNSRLLKQRVREGNGTEWDLMEQALFGGIQADREAAFARRVQEIREWADERCWGKVKILQITVGLGAAEQLMEILYLSAPTIHTLIIWSHQLEPTWWDQPYLQTLDHLLNKYTIAFPHLTTIRIEAFGSSSFDMGINLINAAPNLAFFHLSIDFFDLEDKDADLSLLPKLKGPTKIRSLQIEQGNLTLETNLDFLVQLLRVSPILEQLNVSRIRSYEAESKFPALAEHENLREICWESFVSLCFNIQPQLEMRSIRRLILEGRSRLVILQKWPSSLPAMPNLERIYYTHGESSNWAEKPTPQTKFPVILPVYGILPNDVEQLHRLSSLRIVHTLPSQTPTGLSILSGLEVLEQEGQMNGYISSMRYGYEELLCVRMFNDHVEVLDERIIPPSPPQCNITSYHHQTWRTLQSGEGSTVYLAADRNRRERVFRRQAEKSWKTYTDFRGKVVPLKIIKQMQMAEVEGIDWNRRGVEIGDVAWGILLGWYEGEKGKQIVQKEGEVSVLA